MAIIKSGTTSAQLVVDPLSEAARVTLYNSSGVESTPPSEATLLTRLSESDFDIKTGSLTETAPASDTASSGLNGRLQRIAQRITSLMAFFKLGQGTMAQSLAVTVASDQSRINTAPILPQMVDSGNSATRTAANGAAQFVGTFTPTRSVGVARQLVVLASTVSSGLGGTFIFEYSEDGVTATISESRTITDFATVRDFDLLNSGAYFRVKFTPDRALTGGELLFITTTNRLQNDGQFVRLANQELEEANSAMGTHFSFNKAFNQFSGKSVNIRATAEDTGNSSEALLGIAGVFTGTSQEVGQHKNITVFVASDAAGTLTIQFAKKVADFSDSTLRTTISRDYTAGVGQGYIFSPIANFYRVVYTNGGVAQTKFRLQAVLHHTAVGNIFTRVDTPISDGALAQQTRAVGVGKNPDGVYKNLQSNGQLSNNSTTTPLTAGSTFTGTYNNISSWVNAGINVLTDQAGILNIDFSNDGITLIRTVSYNVLANTVFTIIAPLTTDFFRVRYVNGAVNQASITLDCVLKTAAIPATIQIASSTVASNSLAQTVNAIPIDGVKATYSAVIVGLSPAVAATDILTITGSTSRTVRVLISVTSATRTVAGTVDLQVIKRSTANSGGTSSAVTLVPHDSADPAATATVLAYTANPTLGTVVGLVNGRKMFINTTGGTTDIPILEYGTHPGKAIVLRGTSQVLAINLNGTTITGGSIDLKIEITEE